MNDDTKPGAARWEDLRPEVREHYKGTPRNQDVEDFIRLVGAAEGIAAEAKNSPECFKCQEPITEFNEVRVVTVRVDGERRDVWVHAAHANPDLT